MEQKTKILEVVERIESDVKFLKDHIKVGRPPKDYSKIEEAFRNGMSIEEAVKKFNISRTTSYKLFKKIAKCKL